MKRLLIEIGNVGFMSDGKIDFQIRIATEKIKKDMIKVIINSLEKALEQEID